ncbi:MAG TPA: CoA transferase, partial [Ruegeria sp.]|nr:CoA transferase [Ruegeria sp.]
APTVTSPLRLSATPVEYVQPPPLLGEHTAAVLHDLLGMEPAQIAGLSQAGVIGVPFVADVHEEA